MFRELNLLLLLLLHDHFVIILTNYTLTFVLKLVTGCGIERGIFGIKTLPHCLDNVEGSSKMLNKQSCKPDKGRVFCKRWRKGNASYFDELCRMTEVTYKNMKVCRIILKWSPESMP